MKVLTDELALELTKKVLQNDKDIKDVTDAKIKVLEEKSHNHSNSDVLNSISPEKIQEWDNKSNFDGDFESLLNVPDLATKEDVENIKSDLVTKDEMQDITNDFVSKEEFENGNVNVSIDSLTNDEINTLFSDAYGVLP